MGFTITESGIKSRYHWMLGQEAPSSWVADAIGMVYDSDQAQEKYPFFMAAPQMREWKGGRPATVLGEQEITVTNVKYGVSQPIPGEVIRRAKFDHLDRHLSLLARRYYTHWDKILINLLTAGESTVGYDGQFFFDTDHDESGSSQDNDLTSNVTTTSAPTTAEAATAINAAIGQMLSFVDNEGEPMNDDARSFAILCKPSQFGTFSTAVNAPIVSTGAYAVDNPVGAFNGYSIRVYASARLTADKFYLLRTDGASALIAQEESGPGVDAGVSILGEGSDFAFHNDAWNVGIAASRGVGYGAWQSAVLTTLT